MRQKEVATPAAVRDALLSQVEDRLSCLPATEASRWSAVDHRAAVPIEVTESLIASGGKRLRPAFCLSGFLSADGDPAREPVAVGADAALELLHAFALLHDDVLDDSPLRRGEPTAYEWHASVHRADGRAGEPCRFGEGVAALAGDLTHTYADRLVSALPLAAREIRHELRSEVIIGSTWTSGWRPSASRILNCPGGSHYASPAPVHGAPVVGPRGVYRGPGGPRARVHPVRGRARRGVPVA